MTLKIHPILKSILRPLTLSEREQLTMNLKLAGRAIDTIKTWDGTILDGHNRYEICLEKDLPFLTEEIEGVTSLMEAVRWIIDNERGRRRQTDDELSASRAAAVESLREDKAKAPVKEVAEAFGVSRRTVSRDVAKAKKKPKKRRVQDNGESEDVVEEEPTGRVPVDIDGLAAPYKRATNDITRMVRELNEVASKERTGAHLNISIQRIRTDLQAAKDAIRMAEPVETCLRCKGNGCNRCLETGFLTRMLKSELSSDVV